MIKIDIWSDIVCPFCYIGKRNLEAALEQFESSDDVEITWRSFELSPDQKTDPSQSMIENLASSKGWTVDYARKVNQQVAQTAKGVGLEYRLEETFPVNTFNAHRLLHLAEKHGLQTEMKERLFAANFTLVENVDDPETLVRIASEVGVPESEVRELVENEDLYRDEVKADIQEARRVGVQGVPFFVFNSKYAVSGAQPPQAFLEVLQKVEQEMAEEEMASNNGAAFCEPGGDC